ncbi:MAG: ABC transporter substrate-binding protein [Anaerolineae bacterium]|nr:ABC transporter substrate-binding protein [Anaerolineae bacterium]
MLAAKVQAGELPPVEERLPLSPRVVEPVEEIGQYGGTWRQVHIGTSDLMQNYYIFQERGGMFSPDFAEIVPAAFAGWEVSDDASEFTIHMREGMRWSDGAPFTADDIMFWYEDVVLNDELSPTKPASLKRGGQLGVFEKVDDYTVKIRFAGPYGAFLNFLPTLFPFAPKHYLSQFHPAYTEKAALDKKVAEAELDTWTDLWAQKVAFSNNPGTPTIDPWVVTNSVDQPIQVLERNPYYYSVDTAGNQLPYIDRFERTLVPDVEALLLKAIAGDVDFQARRIASLGNRPVVMENQEKGDYRVIDMIFNTANLGTIFFNYSHPNEELRKLFRNKDFRVALSIAINRQEISDLIFKGIGEPGQVTSSGPYYDEAAWNANIGYDAEAANKMLDDLGLTERDDDGFRLLPDGSRISIVNIAFTPWPPDNVEMQQLVKEYMADVGIEMLVTPTDRQLWVTRVQAADFDVASYAQSWGDPGWAPFTRQVFGVTAREYWAVMWSLWHASGGAEGEEPPEEVKRLQAMYEQVMAEPDMQKRIDLQKEAMAMHAEYCWEIGLIARPLAEQFGIAKNNFRNVPTGDRLVLEPHISVPAAQFFFKS